MSSRLQVLRQRMLLLLLLMLLLHREDVVVCQSGRKPSERAVRMEKMCG